MRSLLDIISLFAQTKYILISFVLSLVVMSIMQVYTFPIIQENAGGNLAFDLSPFGYSFSSAQSFISTLSEHGRWTYLYVQEILDVFYPLFLSTFFTLTIYKLVRKRKQIALIGLLPLIFDYLENILVIVMLNSEDLNSTTVVIASSFTIIKSLTTTICYVFILCLLARLFLSKMARR